MIHWILKQEVVDWLQQHWPGATAPPCGKLNPAETFAAAFFVLKCCLFIFLLLTNFPILGFRVIIFSSHMNLSHANKKFWTFFSFFFFFNSDTFAFTLPLRYQWIQIWGVCLFIMRLKLNWQTGCETIAPVHRWGGERRSYLLQRVYSSLLVTPRGGGRNCQPSWTSVDAQEKKKQKKNKKNTWNTPLMCRISTRVIIKSRQDDAWRLLFWKNKELVGWIWKKEEKEEVLLHVYSPSSWSSVYSGAISLFIDWQAVGGTGRQKDYYDLMR